MTDARGVCMISIPKSGTMFLSRYLERITSCPVVFGIEHRSSQQLAQELGAGWHPAIQEAADPRCTETAAMCRRFAQMLARNRDATDNGKPLILSDHGYTSFLQFLINPLSNQILEPLSLIKQARERGLATVFLYRSLPDVANSLALFLASGKSFLLALRSREQAASLVARLYAPVLAQQTAAWLDIAASQNVLAISYDALIAEPARWIREVARLGNLDVDKVQLQQHAGDYRSWTYRSQQGKFGQASWRDTFTPAQQAVLDSLCTVHEGVR